MKKPEKTVDYDTKELLKELHECLFTKPNPEKTVEEIVEELKFITHPDADGIMGSCGSPCRQCEKDKKIKDYLTKTLQAERQKREELLKAKKISIRQSDGGIHTIILDEGEEIVALTQPNNK